MTVSQDSPDLQINIYIEVDNVRIDITDLFLQDFAIVDELRCRLEALIEKQGTTSPRGVVAEAVDTARDMLDLTSSRVIHLVQRVATVIERETQVTQDDDSRFRLQGDKGAVDVTYRQGHAKTQPDPLSRSKYRRDSYAAMDPAELRQRVGSVKWTEICMRLATGQPVDLKQAKRVAEWFLRGLEIEQAVLKVRAKHGHREM
jgi:hypothetical protein